MNTGGASTNERAAEITDAMKEKKGEQDTMKVGKGGCILRFKGRHVNSFKGRRDWEQTLEK